MKTIEQYREIAEERLQETVSLAVRDYTRRIAKLPAKFAEYEALREVFTDKDDDWWEYTFQYSRGMTVDIATLRKLRLIYGKVTLNKDRRSVHSVERNEVKTRSCLNANRC